MGIQIINSIRSTRQTDRQMGFFFYIFCGKMCVYWTAMGQRANAEKRFGMQPTMAENMLLNEGRCGHFATKVLVGGS